MPSSGACRLCGRDSELRDSHLLPKSMYRLLRSEQYPNSHPRGRDQADETTLQVRQHLLCPDCEQRFNRRGEGWVMGRCWRGDEGFRIREILHRSQPLIDRVELKVYAGAEIPELDMDKIVYFGASVFWRAAAAKWTILGESVHIALGRYEESLRAFLLDNGPFPREMVLSVIVSELEQLDVCLLPVSSRTKSRLHRHRFIIPGLTFPRQS